MWIDTYGNQEPPEVTLNIYFLGEAHHPELARVSDETREVRWFSSENIPVDTLAFAHVEQAIRCWSEATNGEGTA
jgi:hypothetical protein